MMQDVWITTPYGKVFGQAMGENGRPLVLGIHGYSQRNGWQTWLPLMEPLAAADYRVVSLDMPGWGKSVADRPFSYDDYVSVVLAVIEKLRVETAVLLGKSWGGGIALETALKHPEQISHLVLTAPARSNIDPLADLQQPVLMAWSEDDDVIPYKYAAHYVEKIPNIQLETYATGGHSAAQKNVTDFAPKVIRFLGANKHE